MRKWITGFSINLGYCIALVAELWAILHGLRLENDMGSRGEKVGNRGYRLSHSL